MKYEEIISTINSVKGAELEIGIYDTKGKFLIVVRCEDGTEAYYSYSGLICNDEGKDDTFFVKLTDSDSETAEELKAKVTALVAESIAATEARK